MDKAKTLEILNGLIEETKAMSQEEFNRKERRRQLKLIVEVNNLEDAVNKMIEEELCVSKAEAKRVFYQLGGGK